MPKLSPWVKPPNSQAFGSFKLRDAVPDLADNSWFQAADAGGLGMSWEEVVGYNDLHFISRHISMKEMGTEPSTMQIFRHMMEFI